MPHSIFKGELSYQFWGPKLPYSILMPFLRVESSKATSLLLLLGCSGSSFFFPSLGQKKGHLVSCIAFPQLFKLGTELRSCCHLNKLLKTGKASAVVAFGNIGGYCARCQESHPQSLGLMLSLDGGFYQPFPWLCPHNLSVVSVTSSGCLCVPWLSLCGS